MGKQSNNIGGTAVRDFGDRIGWIFCFHAIFLAKCNMSQSSMCKLAFELRTPYYLIEATAPGNG